MRFTATNELLLMLAEGQTNREDVVAGGEFTRDVVLHPLNPAKLSGKIVDPNGKPLAGVIVTAVNPEDRRKEEQLRGAQLPTS
jgi:hypothetical protein